MPGSISAARVRTSGVTGATAGPRAGTDTGVVSTVRSLLKNGGAGVWFNSTLPWVAGKPQSFFLVTRLPTKADPKNPMLLLQTGATRKFLQDSLAGGTPLVLGSVPLAVQVKAAAMGDDVQLGADALKAGGLSGQHNVVLLQPEASKFVVAHELQHWRDFEDKKLNPAFAADMKHFFSAKYLDQNDKNTLYRLMWELRGHNAQAIQAFTDKKSGLPYQNSVGTVETSKKQRDSLYDFEMAHAGSIFSQAYQMTIIELVTKVREHDKPAVKDLEKIFAKYDFSAKPGARVSFKDMVPGI